MLEKTTLNYQDLRMAIRDYNRCLNTYHTFYKDLQLLQM